jgi:hypothetical protein
MNLPTTSQVLAATRHVATFAAGAIAMFGLSAKFNPDQVTAIITGAGNAVNDIIILIGLVTPVISAYLASRSASPAQQIKSVEANPDVAAVITTHAIAADAGPKVVSSLQEAAQLPQVDKTPAAARKSQLARDAETQ